MKKYMNKMTDTLIILICSGLLFMTLPVQGILRHDKLAGGKASPLTASEQTAATVTTAMSAAATTVTVTSMASTVTTSSKSRVTRTTAARDTAQNGSYIIRQNYKSPYYIVVYTGSQSVAVYGKDASGEYTRLVKSFTCSTGLKNSSPTRKGLYKIRAKYRWRRLIGNCYGQYSSSISPDYLFHSVPYDRQDPSSLDDVSYDNLGKAVSHGCIRMCVRDCKWIYDNCPIGTQVHVVWESGPGGGSVPQRRQDAGYSGWDPSDEWAKGNPYFADGADETTSTAATATTATTATTADTAAADDTAVATATMSTADSATTTESHGEDTAETTGSKDEL